MFGSSGKKWEQLRKKGGTYRHTALFCAMLTLSSLVASGCASDDKLRELAEAREKWKHEYSLDFSRIKDQWIQESREEGREEGQVDYQQQILLEQLDLRFKLNKPEKTRIRRCKDKSKLDRAVKHLLAGQDKKEILDTLDRTLI